MDRNYRRNQVKLNMGAVLDFDETEQPTNLVEHYLIADQWIIADQWLAGGMKLVSLAPCFIS